MSRGGWRVAADIGGTFTDLVVAAPDGRCLTGKVLSTPDDYSRGVADAVAAMVEAQGLPPSEVAEVVHATTVATNAIIEQSGARTGLVTTRGFRDVLELRRLRSPRLYDLRFRPPPPLVPRRLRLEVTERLTADGSVLVALDEAEVVNAAKRLEAAGVEAVAVCLLHSYANPAHELRVREIVAESLPQAYVSASAELLPEIREYERTSTTVINAYVGPLMSRYLGSLRRRLAVAGIRAPLQVMQSNGGLMSAEAAAQRPASVVESGPAAGVIAGQVLGERLGLPNLITFDMGGTTAKAAIIEAGQAGRTSEYEVGSGMSVSSPLVRGGGHALKLPVLDVAEVGAGGGSLVWVDAGGALKVGPRSAGADPGPACYGRGGVEPTVTDASLLLGYLSAAGLAGGSLALHPEAACQALAPVAERLGIGPLEAAYGIHAVVNAGMMRALKAVSTHRGRDPRDFTLVAFGGSGPTHAAAIAREMGIGRVLVPPAAGVFSALGLLEAQPEHHYVQSLLAPLGADLCDLLNRVCDQLARDAGNLLGGGLELRYETDLRYLGQAFELAVPLPEPPIGPKQLAGLADAFGREHERTYGHRATDQPVQLVSVRLRARSAAARPQLRPALKGGPETVRAAYFGQPEGSVPTPVLSRAGLGSGRRSGPLLVEDADSTTVVPFGCTACLDASGCIVIEAAP